MQERDRKAMTDSEILAEIRSIMQPPGSADNEGTSHPLWFIITPKFVSSKSVYPTIFAGPFFSRKEAEDHLRGRSHHFSEKSYVYCSSAYNLPSYRRVMDLLKEASTR